MFADGSAIDAVLDRRAPGFADRAGSHRRPHEFKAVRFNYLAAHFLFRIITLEEMTRFIRKDIMDYEYRKEWYNYYVNDIK